VVRDSLRNELVSEVLKFCMINDIPCHFVRRAERARLVLHREAFVEEQLQLFCKAQGIRFRRVLSLEARLSWHSFHSSGKVPDAASVTTFHPVLPGHVGDSTGLRTYDAHSFVCEASALHDVYKDMFVQEFQKPIVVCLNSCVPLPVTVGAPSAVEFASGSCAELAAAPKILGSMPTGAPVVDIVGACSDYDSGASDSNNTDAPSVVYRGSTRASEICVPHADKIPGSMPAGTAAVDIVGACSDYDTGASDSNNTDASSVANRGSTEFASGSCADLAAAPKIPGSMPTGAAAVDIVGASSDYDTGASYDAGASDSNNTDAPSVENHGSTRASEICVPHASTCASENMPTGAAAVDIVCACSDYDTGASDTNNTDAPSVGNHGSTRASEIGIPHASTCASENLVPAGALFDLMVSWDFDGVSDTLEMVHSSGGTLSPDVLRKVRSWALLYHDVCKCMERLDSLHDELLDLISVGWVLHSGDPVQGEVSRAEGLQACGHGDCGSLRRELAEACCEITCVTCGHDFVPGICVETAWLRPVVFTRGWCSGTEFKTVGHFIWDPPCPEKGESIRCPDCVSA
jgi:hypothetical protein